MAVKTKEPQFDPAIHLVRAPLPAVKSMEELGFHADTGVSPVAASEPFQLFSAEAIEHMLAEIFKPEVLDNHSFGSTIAARQIRGYAAKHGPFTLAAWTHPETLALISKIAGIDLVPVGDYEIAHTNLSSNLEANNTNTRAGGLTDGSASGPEPAIVGWHKDSYPFVCVLMMSDCTGMVGGETVLRTAQGDETKIRSPQQGCAVVLQGRYILHCALPAFGARERVTTVTSFRPQDPFVKDDTVLRTVRPVSNLSELYYDFSSYRLKVIESRINRIRVELEYRHDNGHEFETAANKKFLEDVVTFLERTNDELVENHLVVAGELKHEDAVGSNDDGVAPAAQAV